MQRHCLAFLRLYETIEHLTHRKTNFFQVITLLSSMGTVAETYMDASEHNPLDPHLNLYYCKIGTPFRAPSTAIYNQRLFITSYIMLNIDKIVSTFIS